LFVIPAQAGIQKYGCHSRGSGNPEIWLSFPRRQESRNMVVIPAQAGIQKYEKQRVKKKI